MKKFIIICQAGKKNVCIAKTASEAKRYVDYLNNYFGSKNLYHFEEIYEML